MANLLTGCRIICGIALIFIPFPSVPFYLLYIIGGITDVADGLVARKMNITSEKGATFDTVADFIFIVVCIWRIHLAYLIPQWILGWTALILLIKLFNIFVGIVQTKKIVAIHSKMNKITGVALFALPIIIHVADAKYSAGCMCVLAAIAALHEGYCILNGVYL